MSVGIYFWVKYAAGRIQETEGVKTALKRDAVDLKEPFFHATKTIYIFRW